ncbi:MAG: molybdenum cofactor guanylyltransferase [Nocardioides sp.]|uniref:molybdenum cofactor guanylyltransferase n=1 Tax=Nocardioides sp. TaxID=35761 RepID=UPI003F0BAE4D
MSAATASPYAAIVLAGGRGSRLGGVDKGAVLLADAPLLEHVLTALGGAAPVVVVAPERPTVRPVRFTLEDPPYGGPVAGIVAGLDSLAAGGEPLPALVALVAVDMPWVTADTFARLVEAVGERDGAFLHAADGYRQLCGVVRTDRLRAVRPQVADGLSVRRLLAPLDLAVVQPTEREADDVDTWADLEPR